MAAAASPGAASLQISPAASASALSREFQSGKMSAPAQGGSGGGGGSGGSPGEAPRAGAPLGLASRPVQMAAQRALRVRNALTGLGIGAIVVGIYSYTFYSISQEHFLDELELEAKAVQARAPKTSAN